MPAALRRLVLLVGAVMLGTVVLTGLGPPPRVAPGSPAAAASTPVDRGRPVDPVVPRRLRIPAIDVDTAVVDLGLNPDRTLEVPTDTATTGWWSGGTKPGADGPAVVVGHVDSVDGPAVFHRLEDLVPGDEVEVAGAGSGGVVRFVVERLEQHDKDTFPTEAVYGPSDGATLRLVTCSGGFDEARGHYANNTIAFARTLTS